MERGATLMSFSRTFGFAIHSSLIGTLIVAPSFMPTPPYMLLILALVSGFSLIAFFAPHRLEERYEIVSFVFILASVIQIILGTLAQLGPFLPRNIILELGVLFFGLFTPLFALSRITDEPLSFKPLTWNLASLALFYAMVQAAYLITGGIA